MNSVNDAVPGDDELIARIMARDETAFAALYERYADLVYSVALRVLTDAAAAQDVAQEVFIRVWNRPESFDPERGKFMPWLLSVTRNRAVDSIRARGRRRLRELTPVDGAEDPVDVRAPDPASMAVIASEREAVRNALDVLPPEQRQAIELAYFAGLTQQEIAERLATPLGTVKTRVRLAMKKLRGELTLESEGSAVR